MEHAETGDPLLGLVHFLHARQAGLPVDGRVLDMLRDALRHWFRHQGARTLDQALGLTKDSLNRAWTRRLRARMFRDLALLHAFGIGPGRAARLVVKRVAQEVADHPELAFMLAPGKGRGRNRSGPVKRWDTLIEEWESGTHRALRRDAEAEAAVLAMSWSEEARRDYLAKFGISKDNPRK
jgi:hypothetical protein